MIKKMENLIFEINKTDRDTIEVEFKERFEFTVNEKGNKLLLRERSEWKIDGELFYKEISEKNLPEMLRAALTEKGIDAHTHDPHPMTRGRCLCVSSKNQMNDLNSAVDKVKSDLDEMRMLFEKELK